MHRGFTRARTVWFYKLDLDPAIRIARQEFDYIVRTNLFAGDLDDLPRSRELFEHQRAGGQVLHGARDDRDQAGA